MPTSGNLYADLLAIGGGDIEVVSRRLKEFSTYANTVPASLATPAEPAPAEPDEPSPQDSSQAG